MTDKIRKIINRDSYMREWRTKTAVCLMALNVSESFICGALTGSINKEGVKQYAEENNLSARQLWQIIK